MANQEYVINSAITKVRLVSTINITATYNNGTLNNGLGSFLVIPSNTFSIDSKLVNMGDDLLLVGQTKQNENGIYTCIQTGSIYNFSVIQRREDFHTIEQIQGAQYIPVADGLLYRGSIFTVVEPLPNFLGVDPLFFLNQSPTLRSNSFNLTDFTGSTNFALMPPLNLSLFSGNIVEFKNPINMPNALDPELVISASVAKLNGITKGLVIGSAALIVGSGVYLEDALIIGNATDISFATGTIDKATIFGNVVNLMPIGTPTNIANITMQALINSSGLTLQTFNRYLGDASFFFEAEGVTNYVVPAGIAAGQAGDPAGCNAQEVMLCTINGNLRAIPLFTTN